MFEIVSKIYLYITTPESQYKMRHFFILFIGFVFSVSTAQSIQGNLLLHYPFDGNALDSSGNEYHAEEFQVTYVEDRFGNPESAIYFNGVDSYINFPNLEELKPDLPVSFAFWIRYDSNSFLDRELFNTSFEEDRSSGVFFNSQQSTGRFTISFGDGSNNYTPNTRRTFSSFELIETGEWTNIVAIVESETNMKIIVNCVDSGGEYSGFGGQLVYSLTPGSLGRHDRDIYAPANYFLGSIDDFLYWDKALSNIEIQRICNSSLGTTNPDNEVLVRISPNPVNEYFEIESPILFNEIQLFDITGKMVKSNSYNKKQRVADLKEGVYFLILIGEELVVRKKIIIKK